MPLVACSPMIPRLDQRALSMARPDTSSSSVTCRTWPGFIDLLLSPDDRPADFPQHGLVALEQRDGEWVEEWREE